MGKNTIHFCKAFTLVEILIVIVLAGMVAMPFTNMFIFGVRGSNDNAEQVLGFNLAREKIEEIKGLPFEQIKSDYENFRDVFQDRYKYDEAYFNEESFEKYFSDVFTESMLVDSEYKTSHTRLKLLYPKVFLKTLPFYPPEYSKLRRVTKVEQISESAMPSKLKRITVMVFDEQNKKIANLVTIIGLHK